MTRKEVAGLSKLEINSVYQGDCLELMKDEKYFEIAKDRIEKASLCYN